MTQFYFSCHTRPDLAPDALFFRGRAKGYEPLDFDNAVTPMTPTSVAIKVAEWIKKGKKTKKRKKC